MLNTKPTNNPSNLNTKRRLSFLLKDSALYGGAAAISKAFALITFPLLARHFTVEEYGLLDYFLILGGLLSILFIFGQDSAVARYFYEHEEVETRRQLITQSLIYQIVGLILFLPLFWLLADWLTGFMVAAPDRVQIFKILLLQLPFLLLINFSRNLLKWTFVRSHFLVMSLGFTIVQASLLLIAVLIFSVNVTGVLLVSLISSMVFGVLGLFFVRKWLTRPVDFRCLREMLPFAIPYGVISLVGAFSPTLERTLTSNMLGTESLGLYAAGTKIAMLMGLLVSAFQTAWGPFSLSIYKQVDAGYTYNWVLKLFALAMCLAVLMLVLLSQPLILLLATDRYLGAIVVVFPLAMGLVIQATSWITEIGIGISKRAHLSLYAYALGIVITFVGIFLLTPELGLFGVGLGVLLGHIGKAIVASWLAQRAYPLPWQYAPVVLMLSLTMAGALVSFWVGNHFGVLFGNLLIGGTMVLDIVVGWLVLFSKEERRRVRMFLARS